MTGADISRSKDDQESVICILAGLFESGVADRLTLLTKVRRRIHSEL